jgi:hypothetical protein
MFRTWLNSQVVPIEDNRLIADCMQHSLETAMGKYTKKRSPPKRLGADLVAQEGSGQRRRLPPQSDSIAAAAAIAARNMQARITATRNEELVAEWRTAVNDANAHLPTAPLLSE